MCALGAALLSPVPAGAQLRDLPPVPRLLVDTAALVCVKIDAEGQADAYVLDSLGDKARDAAVISWVRQLRFPKGKPGDPGRDSWFPMPVAFGNAKSPKLPPNCAPKANRT
jgi:hypothetical protein